MHRLLSLLMLMLPAGCFAFEPDDIIGSWFTENGEAKVQVYKWRDEYFARIIWLKQPLDSYGLPKKDINNPDPAKRKNTAVGTIVLKNARYTNGEWKGIGYGPKRGKEAECTLNLPNKNILRVTVRYGFLSGSKIWRRSNDSN